jgi:hypothetical protein
LLFQVNIIYDQCLCQCKSLITFKSLRADYASLLATHYSSDCKYFLNTPTAAISAQNPNLCWHSCCSLIAVCLERTYGLEMASSLHLLNLSQSVSDCCMSRENLWLGNSLWPLFVESSSTCLWLLPFSRWFFFILESWFWLLSEEIERHEMAKTPKQNPNHTHTLTPYPTNWIENRKG